jgi:hypothetical protein
VQVAAAVHRHRKLIRGLSAPDMHPSIDVQLCNEFSGLNQPLPNVTGGSVGSRFKSTKMLASCISMTYLVVSHTHVYLQTARTACVLITAIVILMHESGLPYPCIHEQRGYDVSASDVIRAWVIREELSSIKHEYFSVLPRPVGPRSQRRPELQIELHIRGELCKVIVCQWECLKKRHA